MNLKFVKASDSEFTNPICPFCKKELNEVKTKVLKNNKGLLGNLWEGDISGEFGMAFFCPSCKSLLGISNRP